MRKLSAVILLVISVVLVGCAMTPPPPPNPVAYGRNWELIGVETAGINQGTHYFCDPKKTAASGRLVKSEARVVDRWGWETVADFEVDCASKRSRAFNIHTHIPGHDRHSRQKPNEPWQPYASDPAASRIAQRYCR
jgi:hypothetical protein